MRTVDPAVWTEERRKSLQKASRRFRIGLERPAGVEARLRRSLLTALWEYFENYSFRGMTLTLSWIRDIDQQLYKRVRLALSVCVLVCACGSVAVALRRLEDVPPLKVSLSEQEYRYSDVDFPAVGVCANNLVSKRRAMDYAKYLKSKSPNNSYTLSRIYKNVVQYGGLTDARLDWVDPEFRTFISEVDPRRARNSTEIMYMLSTSCDELLYGCAWRGQVTPCEELFALRPTSIGFCCMFNSHYEQWDVGRERHRVGMLGEDQGLVVVVQQEPDDYAYVRRPARLPSAEILVVSSGQFPLMEGGALRPVVAVLNMSVFISVSADHQTTSPSVSMYSQTTRGCQLVGRGGASGWRRSYEWCLTLCRRDAVRELCGCVPYYFPREPADAVCALGHLGCLNKHREKFLMFYPFGAESTGVEEEYAESLFCPDCVPDCARTRYSTVVYTSRILAQQPQRLFNNYMLSEVGLSNQTVVRVFFSPKRQELYILHVTLSWGIVFLRLGGGSWLFMGTGLVATWELVYHLTVRWWTHYNRLSHTGMRHRATAVLPLKRR